MSLRTVALIGWISVGLNALIVVAILAARRRNVVDQLATEAGMILGVVVLAMAAGLWFAQRQNAPTGIWIAAAAPALPWIVMVGVLAFNVLGAGEQLLKGGWRRGFPDARLNEISRAISRGDTARVRALITEPGLDLAATDDRGSTLLQLAILRVTTRFPHADAAAEAARILVGAGAPLDRDEYARVVTYADDDHLPLIEALLQAGADPDPPTSPPDVPLVFEPRIGLAALGLIARYGADLHRLHPGPGHLEGWTAPMVAAHYGRWDAALFFLEQGVSPHHQAPDGATLDSIIRVAEGAATERAAPEDLEALRRLTAAVAASH